MGPNDNARTGKQTISITSTRGVTTTTDFSYSSDKNFSALESMILQCKQDPALLGLLKKAINAKWLEKDDSAEDLKRIINKLISESDPYNFKILVGILHANTSHLISELYEYVVSKALPTKQTYLRKTYLDVWGLALKSQFHQESIAFTEEVTEIFDRKLAQDIVTFISSVIDKRVEIHNEINVNKETVVGLYETVKAHHDEYRTFLQVLDDQLIAIIRDNDKKIIKKRQELQALKDEFRTWLADVSEKYDATGPASSPEVAEDPASSPEVAEDPAAKPGVVEDPAKPASEGFSSGLFKKKSDNNDQQPPTMRCTIM